VKIKISYLAMMFVTVFLFGYMTNSYSEVFNEKIEVYYRNINVYFNGELITLKNGDGEEIEPFIHEGSSYVPLRAIANLFGSNVMWDGNKNTIFIGENNQETITVYVDNVRDLIKELGSNKTIVLEPGIYNLSEVENPGELNKRIKEVEVYDGIEFVLGDIFNFTLEGIGEEETNIVVEPRYAYVLNFVNGENISIKNITVGHTEKGFCIGGVLKFSNVADVDIFNSKLYGSGTVGITMENVDNLKVEDSYLYECTYNLLDIIDSRNISFIHTEFRNSGSTDLIQINSSENILFDQCTIEDNLKNRVFEGNINGEYIFRERNSQNINIINSVIRNNACSGIVSEGSNINIADTKIDGNDFVKSESIVYIKNIDRENEIVTLKNNSDQSVNIKDWWILSEKGEQKFIFKEEYFLEAGMEITIVSGESEGDFKWSNGYIWNNDEDKGVLYNNLGEIVSEYQ
jgi:predicted small secreted protein